LRKERGVKNAEREGKKGSKKGKKINLKGNGKCILFVTES